MESDVARRDLLSPTGVLTYDGIHLTAEGNRLLADGFVREVRAKPRPR